MMLFRLCAVLALPVFVFLVLGVPPRPSVSAPVRAPRPTGFEPPELILDGSVHGDRLYPYFADFDGDGITDLLVGVSDRLRVYRNLGTDDKPVYAKPFWFDEINPSARIPGG